MSNAPIEIFCSYADEDEDHLKDLDRHLSAFKHNEILFTWHSSQIIPGTDINKAISTHMKTASLILLLVSPDFLASEHCYKIEMQQAMQRHKAGEARVIPIIVRPCDWSGTPFSQIQCLPYNKKPVTMWGNHDAAWLDVVIGIKQELLHSVSAAHPILPPIGKVPFSQTTKGTQEHNQQSMLNSAEVMSPPIKKGSSGPQLDSRDNPTPPKWPRRAVLFAGSIVVVGGVGGILMTILERSPAHISSRKLDVRSTVTVRTSPSPIVSSIPSDTATKPPPPDPTALPKPAETSVSPLSRETILQTCTGHTSYVYSVAWSPDGKWLASASADMTVRVWNASAGSQVRNYQGHSDQVYSVAWSPDGKWLASASLDYTVKVWDASTQSQALYTYTGHTGIVYSVAWSPDGKRLASASDDKSVKVWDASTQSQALYTYTRHTGIVWSVAWSPDGKRLASASADKTMQVWNASDGSWLLTYSGHSSDVFSVAWSSNSKWLASASRDTTTRVWDANTNTWLFTYTGHSSDVWAVAWSPDSARLASASSDHTVKVWQGP